MAPTLPVAASLATSLPPSSPGLPQDFDLASRISAFFQQHGVSLQQKPPTYANAPIDLCRLYREVKKRGGFERVTRRSIWDQVAHTLYPVEHQQQQQASAASASEPDSLALFTLTTTLSVTYHKYLYAFEVAGKAEEQQQQQRRRQRQALPHLPHQQQQQQQQQHDVRMDRVHDAASILGTVGLAQLQEVRAISTLNKLTADGDLEILLESSAPELLDAIADSLDRHNAPMQQVWQARLARPPPWLDPVERHVTKQDPGPLVLGLLSIVRNLSYIVANEEPIAYHTRVLAHLGSLLPCAFQGSGSSRAEVGTCVMDILVAIAQKVDVTGPPMEEEELLAAEGVPEDSLMALAPAHLRAQSAASHQDPVRRNFVAVVLGLFSLLTDLLLLQEEEDRHGVLRCLELLARLMTVEANAQRLARTHASPAFLLRLYELLYVPRQGLDALWMGPDYLSSEAGASSLRYTHPPQRQQQVDTEVRDWSLEVLASLCAFREVRAALLEHVPGLVHSLVVLLPTTPQMAGHLLSTLAASGGRPALEACKGLLTHYAFRGEVAAELLWSVFLAPASLQEDEEEEEEGGAGEDDPGSMEESDDEDGL